MRIMPIINQISYKGNMIFENDVITSNIAGSGLRKADFANIDPKKIESITSADSFVYRDKIEMDDYKTVIKMDSGDCFFVKPDPKTVSEINEAAYNPAYAKRNWFFNGDEYGHWSEEGFGKDLYW